MTDIGRRFDHALLVGCPSPDWRVRLEGVATMVDSFDPGPAFARTAGGTWGEEDRYDFGVVRYDLIVAVGTFDTVNGLPAALAALRRALQPDAPLIGALAGGDTLPALRAAMIEADRASGPVAARTHPRIEAPTLASLLHGAGLCMAVVDIDRVRLRYPTLDALIRDLRAMGASNALADRAPGRGRRWADRASAAFRAQAIDGATEERVDILHFIAWAPS
ncbi:MAG: SAM-dependent methyltransferase [Sphingomonas bacterium]|nr:SAM-dependent methyltransferase [Sphingomonas bacterium]